MNALRINNYAHVSMSVPKNTPEKTTTSPSQPNIITTNPADVLVDKNYARLQVSNNNRIAFKGVPKVPVKTVGEKVGNLFNVLRANDVIIAAPDMKTAVNSIDKHLDSFKTVIKRIFFIEDKSLKQTLGFRKNLEDREVVNLSDNLVFIKDSKNQAAPLRSGEAGYLLPGDTIKAGNTEIAVTNHEETALPVKDSFTAFVDLKEDVETSIMKLNRNSIRKLQDKQNGAGKNKAITFADVGGQDNVIKALKRNILFPIENPELNEGVNANKAILLYGPPGTGKSLIAEATANETKAWYKKINASELESKYVGESEEHWRELFDEAKKNQPAIIFIDEFDAVAKKRGGHDVYGDKTLNTILGLMSDSEKRGDDIYMIAATNNRNALDSAATRSGRFGLSLEVGPPDKEGTKQILKIHTKKQALDKDFDFESTVEKLYKEKATGADIAAISAEARNNALEREHIYEKMENGTYKKEDMANLRVKNEDYDLAIENFKKSRDSKPARNAIGFNSPIYQ